MSKVMCCPNAIYERLRPRKVLVIGDFMLDVYTVGCVKRISPEAPVPVLCVTHEHARAGGAGNAALNLLSLGMQVSLLGRVGNDASGRELLAQLKQEGACTASCVVDPDFITPRKNRMMADHHQIVRVDYEQPCALSKELEQQIIAQLPTILQGVEIVAISDYAKGLLTPTLLHAIMQISRVPVIVDPKGMDFTRYRGATVIKPNIAEACAAAGLGIEATLDEVAAKILNDVAIETLIITRSQEGISLFQKGKAPQNFPVHVYEVRDVTGAGDTVLAMLTAAMANHFEMSESVRLANIAAAIAIARTGCARISLQDLIQSHLTHEIAH